MKDKYDLSRYFGNSIPNNVSQTLDINGLRTIKSGSKFKIHNERGEHVFIYVIGDDVTCFTPAGQFKTIKTTKIKRTINRSKRERLSGK